jgi:hypothetical protein
MNDEGLHISGDVNTGDGDFIGRYKNETQNISLQ